MKLMRVLLPLYATGAVWAQQYVISTYAGGAPPPTPAAAVDAGIGWPQNLATDAVGNVYFASLNCAFKLDRDGVLTRVAGNSRAGFSGDGGPALNAQIFLTASRENANPYANRPVDAGFAGGIAVDSAGNVYIADTGNNRIREVSKGIITTLAGTGNYGHSGDGGPAVNAQLSWPYALAIDSAGNLFVAENFGRIRKVSPDGIITTVAGGGANGLGDGGPATSAQLSSPVGLAVDGMGTLYIADRYDARIRKVSTDGIITTVARTFTGLGDGGPAINGVAVDDVGNLYIEDYDSEIDYCVVRKASGDGTITTLAGSATSCTSAMAVDNDGNVYLADYGRIRKVSSAGTITTVAGNGSIYSSYSGDGGPAIGAQLSNPWGVAVDSAGNVYVADTNNNRVRRVSPDGVVTAATGNGTYGYSGDGGPAIDAQLSGPVALAVDAADNLYIADINNSCIRKVSPAGIITTVAGNGAAGYSGDGGPALSARLNSPRGVAIDRKGNLYITDNYNSRVRKVSPDGIITTVAGNGTYGYSGDGGPPASAQIGAFAIAVDSAGDLYIADPIASVIRKVSPTGLITTVAGPGFPFDAGDGGPATAARIFPTGLAIDGADNLYIADSGRYRIRKISPDGIIITVAGTGSYGYSGDGGPALNGQLGDPFGLAVDSAGNVFVADRSFATVRRLQPVTR